jgi:hypothetical protein
MSLAHPRPNRAPIAKPGLEIYEGTSNMQLQTIAKQVLTQ